jgi:hypothetical protein
MLTGLIVGAVVGGIVALISVLMRSGGGSGAPGAGLRPGTRAWEASMTLDVLAKAIDDRRAELHVEADPAKKDRLGRELAFLEKQVPELQALVAANDGTPGRGYIGFDNLPPD